MPRFSPDDIVFTMMPQDKDKPKRPWSGFGYLVLVVIAILVAYFIVRPIGQEVASVFQTLTNAFSNGK